MKKDKDKEIVLTSKEWEGFRDNNKELVNQLDGMQKLLDEKQREELKLQQK